MNNIAYAIFICSLVGTALGGSLQGALIGAFFGLCIGLLDYFFNPRYKDTSHSSEGLKL